MTWGWIAYIQFVGETIAAIQNELLQYDFMNDLNIHYPSELNRNVCHLMYRWMTNIVVSSLGKILICYIEIDFGAFYNVVVSYT